MSKIFVSYTSSDHQWAKWLGQELMRLGHVPRIHEWELHPGGDIPKWMETALEEADHCLCVVSKNYMSKPYSSWERHASEWAAKTSRQNFVWPIFIEEFDCPVLFSHYKRCSLYGLTEESARKAFELYIKPPAPPSERVIFPPNLKDERQIFPNSNEIMPWDEYWRRADFISNKLRDAVDESEDKYIPDIVIGITNGGVVFAELLARSAGYKCPILSLFIRRDVEGESAIDNEFNDGVAVSIKRYISSRRLINPRILIVDDLIYSGASMRKCIEFLENNCGEITMDYLPLIYAGASKIEICKDKLIWLRDPFNLSETLIDDMHLADPWRYFPYGKYIKC